MTSLIPATVADSPAPVRHFSINSAWVNREDLRFDATAYAEEGNAALRILKTCKYDKVPLGQLVDRVYHPTENQPRSNFKRIWVNEGQGPPFLTGRQLRFFRPDREKFISEAMPKLHELRPPKGTILLTRSGTTGFPVLVGKWLSRFAVTDDALRIFPGSTPSGFIYAFLASSIGHPLIVKREYGSTVSHIEAKHVAALPVPLLPSAVQESIDSEIRLAYSLRDNANDLLDEAAELFRTELHLPDFDESASPFPSVFGQLKTFSVRAAELEGRFDASFHIPLAKAAVDRLRRGKYPLVRLGHVAKPYIAPRFRRIYVTSQYGVPFLQGSDVPLMKPHAVKYLSRRAHADLSPWIIRKDWVLITCSGTVGRIGLVLGALDGWAASQHIERIVPDLQRIHPGYLVAFLMSPYGQRQLTSKVYGGVVDELTEEDTSEVRLPKVPMTVQERIGRRVVRAFRMRDDANDAENRGVSCLETALLEDRRHRLSRL